MKQFLIIIASGALAVSAIALGFTYLQAYQERTALTTDLAYRTHVLSDSLVESIEPLYNAHATSTMQANVDKFVDHEHLVGVLVTDAKGEPHAVSTGMPAGVTLDTMQVARAMDSDAPVGRFIPSAKNYYAYVQPLHDESKVVGSLVVIQNAAYIDQNIAYIWKNNLARLFFQILFFFIIVALLVRWLIMVPLSRLEKSIQSFRQGEATEPPNEHTFFFRPLAHEISRMAQSLLQARSAASEEARLRLERIDTAWTAERLKEFVRTNLKDRPIYVVSNREPYIHTKTRNKIAYSVPASGMVTALESVMEACGGEWLAHGSGNADRDTADDEGKIEVPPEEPKYTLKRVWLSEEDVKGFYTGFSNEALWALCHLAHNRPIFRAEDWAAYRRVNGMFAEQLLAEIKGEERPIILVQDFHFALLPQMIKKSRPDALVGIFWHIPWPSAEQFSICPWRKEILEGMLGADVVGFHTQQYCNNFMDTVGKEIESLIDFERFAIVREGHQSRIKPFPISIAFTDADLPEAKDGETLQALEKLGVTSEYVGLGVDRLDYTKGVLERMKAIEFFFDEHVDMRERFTFIQISSPSRESVPKYREYGKDVEKEITRINEKFATGNWKPIVFEHRHYSHEELAPLYRAAHVCMVTSLHDGMNLVAKEYVAAQSDESGVLILSKFTGASRDLMGAIIVNPYSAEETAEALWQALTMSPARQHMNMKMMRNAVRDYNVYRWSAEFLKAVANLA